MYHSFWDTLYNIKSGVIKIMDVVSYDADPWPWAKYHGYIIYNIIFIYRYILFISDWNQYYFYFWGIDIYKEMFTLTVTLLDTRITNKRLPGTHLISIIHPHDFTVYYTFVLNMRKLLGLITTPKIVPPI